MKLSERLRAAWRAFEEQREYWRGWRDARAPMLVVLRTLQDKHRDQVTITKWQLMKMLYPGGVERQRVERLIEAEEEIRNG